MRITVLYFASLREALSLEREELDIPAEVHDLSALRNWLAQRGAVWQALLAPRIRAAVNQRLAGDAVGISEGDEIAFFPPVTGG